MKPSFRSFVFDLVVFVALGYLGAVIVIALAGCGEPLEYNADKPPPAEVLPLCDSQLFDLKKCTNDVGAWMQATSLCNFGEMQGCQVQGLHETPTSPAYWTICVPACP